MGWLPDRLPLIIGVTGHRDLRDEDVPRLEQEISAIISRLRRDYVGHKQETPIIVLSALAEGADRLVARVALAHGAQLIAPLPMPLEEYRRDFEPGLKPGNVTEFDNLFAQAISAPIMPVYSTSVENQENRANQYRAVGIFIAQHCHVLLALWDQDENGTAAGGTAEVVSFKRDGIPLLVSGLPRACLDASEIGPVIEIITPRAKDRGSMNQVSIPRWGRGVIKRYRGGVIRRNWHRAAAFVAQVFGRELEDARSILSVRDRREFESWETFKIFVDLTRRFNRDAATLGKKATGPTRIVESIDHLFTDPEIGMVDLDAKIHAVNVAPLWARLYGIADTLAQERQSLFKWDWKLIFLFAIIAFFCFGMFARGGYAITNVFLALYILSLISIFMLIARAKFGEHQERYLDYRALAEGLRVGIYWKLVGIGSPYFDAKSDAVHDSMHKIDAMAGIANAYPIKQPSELAWVKTCLRTIETLDKLGSTPTHKVGLVGHTIARRFWVKGQLIYFREQGQRHNGFAKTIEARSAILLALAPVAFLSLLVFDVAHDWYGVDVKQSVIILIGLLPGVAAAWTGYSERLAFKAQARQYDRMRMLFESAYNLLPENIDNDTAPLAQTLYHELGMEAMRESAEWTAIYRQRPIQTLRIKLG